MSDKNKQVGNWTPEKAEYELNKIIRDGGSVVKPKLADLAIKLRLAITDPCTGESPAHKSILWERISEWIRNERAELRAKRIIYATLAAAVAAAISAACALVTILNN